MSDHVNLAAALACVPGRTAAAGKESTARSKAGRPAPATPTTTAGLDVRLTGGAAGDGEAGAVVLVEADRGGGKFVLEYVLRHTSGDEDRASIRCDVRTAAGGRLGDSPTHVVTSCSL